MTRKGEARVAARRARAAGLLLHPTSLPGRFPIGDLGPSAVAMLDWITIPLSYPFMQRALVVSLLVAAVCAVLSCYLVLKGWSLM